MARRDQGHRRDPLAVLAHRIDVTVTPSDAVGIAPDAVVHRVTFTDQTPAVVIGMISKAPCLPAGETRGGGNARTIRAVCVGRDGLVPIMAGLHHGLNPHRKIKAASDELLGRK